MPLAQQVIRHALGLDCLGQSTWAKMNKSAFLAWDVCSKSRARPRPSAGRTADELFWASLPFKQNHPATTMHYIGSTKLS